MKALFHAPGLILIALCGLACGLIGLERAEDWLDAEYDRVARLCQ